jgi:hypothetical protein
MPGRGKKKAKGKAAAAEEDPLDETEEADPADPPVDDSDEVAEHDDPAGDVDIYTNQNVLSPLDLDHNKELKAAYGRYCDTLKDTKDDMMAKIALMCSYEMQRLGAEDQHSHWTTIHDKLTPLAEILPLYVEAIVQLSLEQCNGATPLEWWRDYRTKIRARWFEKIFHRIPRDNMNTRMHDESFFRMDGEDLLRAAACFNFELSFEIEELLLLVGRSDDEMAAMRMEIDIDKEEDLRRYTVWGLNVTSRLTYDSSAYESKEAAMRELTKEGLDSYTWLRSVDKHREVTRLEKELDVCDGMEVGCTNQIRALSVHNAAHLRTLTTFVEHQNTLIKELMEDLKAGHGRGRGSARSYKGSVTRGEQPAWMEKCDAAVKALDPEKALRFESHGREESEVQTRGRKMRDDVLADYNNLWDDKGLTWAKLPVDTKIEICDRMGRAPLNWPPDITAKRITNYIGKRRASSKKGTKEKTTAATPKSKKKLSAREKKKAAAKKKLESEVCVFDFLELC